MLELPDGRRRSIKVGEREYISTEGAGVEPQKKKLTILYLPGMAVWLVFWGGVGAAISELGLGTPWVGLIVVLIALVVWEIFSLRRWRNSE